MSNKKYSENDPERTLITLDQLRQTIEVMTSVVNRLRQHLSQQIVTRKEIEEIARKNRAAGLPEPVTHKPRNKGVVVEVSQPDSETDTCNSEKTLH